MGRVRDTAPATDRALTILEHVVEYGRPISLTELTRLADLPKPTVYRLAKLLEERGYLARDIDPRRYRPGHMMTRLGMATLQSLPSVAARQAILRDLSREVGETCNIVILNGTSVRYLDRIETDWPLRFTFDIGAEVPIHCTATGKLLLSLQPPSVRNQILDAVTLSANTPRTFTDREALWEELERVRDNGYGTDDQEFLDAMVAVSIPIPPPSGPSVAAVSIHAPVVRRSLDELRKFLPQLRIAAEALSRIIYHPAAEISGHEDQNAPE